jgi:hypothetical protein
MLQGFLAKEGAKAAFRIAKWALPLAVIVGLGIYVAVLKGELRHERKVSKGLSDWQSTMVAAVAAETPPAHRNHVGPSTAVGEVQWLGREYRTYRAAVERQNEQLRIAEGKATAAQKAAVEARGAAVQANSEREAIRQRLLDPKRSTGLTEAEWGKL